MVETYWQMFVLHCCSSLAAFPVFTPLSLARSSTEDCYSPQLFSFSFCTAWAKQQNPLTKPQQVTVEIQRRQLPTFKHWAGLFGWWSRQHILGMTLFPTRTQPVTNSPVTHLHTGSLGWAGVKAGHLITLFNQNVLVQGRKRDHIRHYVELKNICFFFHVFHVVRHVNSHTAAGKYC